MTYHRQMTKPKIKRYLKSNDRDKNGGQRDVFKVLGNKIKYCQSKTVCSEKITFKNEGKINIFSE